jgi:hypothetical protein
MKQPVFILISVIATAFLFASLLYAATVADVMQAIAQEKAQVEAYSHTVSTSELACDTQYWAHNMINVRYDNGVWYYSCRTPWEGDGVLATNVYQ